MKSTTKNTYLKSIIINALIFLILALFIDKMSMGIVLLVLILPIIVNSILIKKEYKLTNEVNNHHYLLPITSFIIYIIFGLIVKSNGKWDVFRLGYGREVGETYIEIANSPIDVSQLIFTLIMYVAIGYLITRVITSKSENDKNKRRNRDATRSKSFE